MDERILGIHHVTAIAGDAQSNVDFYAGVLGLRLVKRTVNFDDPGTWHLYYGDELGRPGTILTFFPWVGMTRGRRGTGQATLVSFSIAEWSVGWWVERLEREGVDAEGPFERFGEEQVLSFVDPDGLRLELVAHARADERPGWPAGPLPAEHAIRGLHSATLSEEGYEHTAALLAHLGFRPIGEFGGLFRFEVGEGGPGALLDVLVVPEEPGGLLGAGVVHHVAWRTSDEEEQKAWRRRVVMLGRDVTPPMDRKYFRSIYFREPGGVLFEIATDPPGFTVDEPAAELGSSLKLPPWLEPARERIEPALAPLRAPAHP